MQFLVKAYDGEGILWCCLFRAPFQEIHIAHIHGLYLSITS